MEGQMGVDHGYKEPGPGFNSFSFVPGMFGMNAGEIVGGAGIQSSVNRAVERMSSYKRYFRVTHSYVVKKLSILAYPYSYKNTRQSQEGEFLPPSEDVNAPDLYIPLMSFITYVLLVGYFLASLGRFTPEVLGKTATVAVILLLVEACVLKCGFLLLSVETSASMVDFVAWCGYKFVGVNAALLIRVVGFPTVLYYIAMLWFCFAMAVFLVKTLRRCWLSGGPDGAGKMGKGMTHFLFIFAVLQFPIMIYHGYLPE